MNGVGWAKAATRSAGLRAATPSRWPLVSMLGLGLCTLGVAVVMLGVGDYELSPLQSIHALFGSGFEHRVVAEWRAPREVACLVGGGALGAAGWVFQSITRNPLGSPDVIGVSSGAFVGVLLAILVFPAGLVADPTVWGAAIGAALTAAIVFAVAQLRRSGGSPFGIRLVLVGVAVGGMLQAVASWLLLVSKVEVGQAASVWAFGTLAGIRWHDLTVPMAVVAAIGLALTGLRRPLRILELGDDTALALGVNVTRLRITAMGCGVLLVAAVAAFAGPIAFVALAAPHAARFIQRRSAGPASSAVAGAALLTTADAVAQRAFAPTQLPVGLITLCIGGVFLVALLLSRRTTGRTP